MTPEARARQRIRFPVLALTAGAWVALVVVGMPHAQTGEGVVASVPGSGVGLAATHSHLVAGVSAEMTPAGQVGSAVLMLTAMMAPLLIPALRHVVDRSLPSRRARSATLLTLGYAGTWVVAWLALGAAASGLRRAVGAQPAFLAGVVLMLVWQSSPAKQRLLNRCHRRPSLAAFGHAADQAALRFGTSLALWCIGSCWALMLLPLLAPDHALLLMGMVAVWLWAERVEPVRPARWGLRGPVTSLRIGVSQAGSWVRRAPGLRSRA